MSNWEYLTLQIPYEKKRKNWVVEYAGQSLVGLERILGIYGAQSWELVAMTPAHFTATPGFGQWYVDTAAYRATFKRPV